MRIELFHYVILIMVLLCKKKPTGKRFIVVLTYLYSSNTSQIQHILETLQIHLSTCQDHHRSYRLLTYTYRQFPNVN